MKDKNLPNDYESSSLEELTLEANKIIEDLESQKDLQNSIEKYQNLIKLNNIIEKKFKKKVTDINTTTKDNISKIHIIPVLGLHPTFFSIFRYIILFTHDSLFLNLAFTYL